MDIFFDEKFCKLYENIEEGTAESVTFTSKDGTIYYPFIKRLVVTINDFEYYDITSPYGYGGPIIKEQVGDKKRLVAAFKNYMETYCQENRIISEFIRFHPLEQNALSFKDYIFQERSRVTIGINTESLETYEKELQSRHRRYIKRTKDRGFREEIIYPVRDLTDFQKFYYERMNELQAKDMYYFGEEHFKRLIDYYQENLLMVCLYDGEEIISMYLTFVCEDYLYAYIGGAKKKEYDGKITLAGLTYDIIARWGVKHDKKLFHLGGGLKADLSDSLFKHKKKFTKNGFYDFYIGKKIHLPAIYEKLLQGNEVLEENQFPAYRNLRSLSRC